MTTIRTKEYEKELPFKTGGDLWNENKLCRIAFKKYPQAEKIEYSIGTGLWVSIKYTTKSGEIHEGVIYESDDHKF